MRQLLNARDELYANGPTAQKDSRQGPAHTLPSRWWQEHRGSSVRHTCTMETRMGIGIAPRDTSPLARTDARTHTRAHPSHRTCALRRLGLSGTQQKKPFRTGQGKNRKGAGPGLRRETSMGRMATLPGRWSAPVSEPHRPAGLGLVKCARSVHRFVRLNFDAMSDH